MIILRTRIGISFGLIGTIFVFINGFQWLEFKASELAGLDMSTGVAFIVFLFLFKFKKLSLNQFGFAFIICLWINTFITIYVTGGARSDEIVWLLLMPVFAQVLISSRGGLVFFVITAVSLIVLFALYWNGVKVPQMSSTIESDKILGWTITLFGSFAALFFTSALFQAAIGISINQLTETKDKAEVVSKNLSSILSQIKINSISLNDSSSGLAKASTRLEKNANTTFEKTVHVFDSSRAINNKVDIVSEEIKSATVRMSGIAEITLQAKNIADEGNRIAEETSNSMDELKRRGEDSVSITNMIQQTSKQLKLLSLNAAIEAANAGEHGQGFAIVANQVKNLAEKTSAATENVAEINKSIQITTEKSADYLSKLVEIIQSISQFQDTISISVAEQLSATKTISENLAETSNISSLITKSINEVVTATDSNQKEVKRTHQEAESLALMSRSLSQLLEIDSEEEQELIMES